VEPEPSMMSVRQTFSSLPRISSFAAAAEYTVLGAYFAYVWWSADDTLIAATHVSNIVFAEFLGQFLTVIIGKNMSQKPSWGEGIAVVAFSAFGVFVLLDFAESLLAACVWMASITIGLLRDRNEVFVGAILQGGWMIVAAFLAALAGSMAGVDPDALLTTNLGTVAGWGILYYAGLLTALAVNKGDKWLSNKGHTPHDANADANP